MVFKVDAEKVKRWREEHHWSQEHLAELAGIGLRTLQRIEKGEQASRESIKALAAAFNVDMSALALDPDAHVEQVLRDRQSKASSALRLSLWIHLASFLIGAVTFTGISLGIGGDQFAMKWPLIWWVIAIVSHASVVIIVEAVRRYQHR